MFPLALILISLYPIFSRLGLLNTHIALILAYVVFALPAASSIGPGLLFTYLGEFQNDWGGAMAASIVTSVPIILAFTLLQRFFVQGLTAGAVKS